MDNTGSTISKKLWRKIFNNFLSRIRAGSDAFVRKDMNDFLADVVNANIQIPIGQIANGIAHDIRTQKSF